MTGDSNQCIWNIKKELHQKHINCVQFDMCLLSIIKMHRFRPCQICWHNQRLECFASIMLAGWLTGQGSGGRGGGATGAICPRPHIVWGPKGLYTAFIMHACTQQKEHTTFSVDLKIQ